MDDYIPITILDPIEPFQIPSNKPGFMIVRYGPESIQNSYRR